MSTLEERLQTLEQEHTHIKKTIELQTIAIGALVNKATLEKLNEKHDKLFDALAAHDHLTNEQLAELRTQQIEEDGKIIGLQTEMRQRFNEQDSTVTELQTEMRQRFNEQGSTVTELQTEMRQRFNEQGSTVTELQATQSEHTALLQQHTALLQQILARLPEQKL